MRTSQLVENSTVSSSSILYTWNPYILLVGEVLGFDICLKKDLSQSGCDILGNLGPTDTSYTATGLDSSTVYYATIVAQTSVGTSLVSDSVSATTEGGGEIVHIHCFHNRPNLQ